MGLMGFLTKFADREKLFYLAMLGAAACEIVLAAMPNIALAALFTVPTGFGAGLTWVTGYTLLQENAPDEYRGRTFATLNVWGRMALFISLAGFPGLAAAVGPTHFVTIGGRVLDFGGTRIAMWLGGAVVVFGGMFSRKGLGRARLARPRPLALTPRLHMAQHDGMFVVFEGVEGAGKGTQIELARRYLESSGREVVVTREPGGTEFGDRLRQAILDPATGHVEPRAEALLFAASRAQHVVHVIRPALAEGKVVLCDRFIDSSVAYQGVARGLGEQDVLTLNAWATQGLFPDLVVLLDVDPGAGLARAGGGLDRIESEDASFHAKVADAYLKIAEEHPERFVVVDALGKPEEVHERVRSALDKLLSAGEAGRAGPT
jgi:dTMP kinase